MPIRKGEPWVQVTRQLPTTIDGTKRGDTFPGTGVFILDNEGTQIGKVTPFATTPPRRYAGWMTSVMYGKMLVLFGVDPSRIEKTIVSMKDFTDYEEYELNGFEILSGVDDEGEMNVIGIIDDFFIAVSLNEDRASKLEIFNKVVAGIDTEQLLRSIGI